jgi:hypothetical protein
MPLTRRELCSVFPVALLPALFSVEEPSARQSSLPSAMYPFNDLPVRTANNAQFRAVLKGRLVTGIREGTVELAVGGTSYRLGPGSVGFVHSNDEHGIKNVGATPATYFVVAIGPEADS